MKKRKLIIFVTLVSVCFLAYSIVYTFAKYSNEYNRNTNIDLTSWRLKINNDDVKNNSDFSSTLVPTFTSNPHIANNVIVPTSTGYFDVELDISEIDLAFSYTIIVNNTNSNVLDYKVTGYSVNNESTISYTNSITNTITPSDNIDSITYRFFVEWIDTADNVTDNAEDTNLAVNRAVGNINAHITFEQADE